MYMNFEQIFILEIKLECITLEASFYC